MLSYTEENYLKALLMITTEHADKSEAGTNELAAHLHVKPATANDMLKKLKEKKLISYEKYGKITLTKQGRKIGISVIRKHRLWETFLFEKLGFTWDEVHEVAEQLEHIQSEKLVEKLDQFLQYPQFDPHGDPIPKSNGQLPKISTTLLSEINVGDTCAVVAVKDTSVVFLQYLHQLSIGVGTKIKVIDQVQFDGSLLIEVDNKKTSVSLKLAESLLVKSL